MNSVLLLLWVCLLQSSASISIESEFGCSEDGEPDDGNCKTFTFSSIKDIRNQLFNGGGIGRFIREQLKAASDRAEVATTERSPTTLSTEKNPTTTRPQSSMVFCELRCDFSQVIEIKSTALQGIVQLRISPSSVTRQWVSLSTLILCNGKTNCSIKGQDEEICKNISYTCVEPDQAVGWELADNGLWYKYFSEHETYDKAVSSCGEFNARLISSGVRNETVKRNLFHQITGRTWIGLRRRNTTWVWSDNSTIPPNDAAWKASEPNNSGGEENCVWNNGKHANHTLNDARCTIPLPYICEAILTNLLKLT